MDTVRKVVIGGSGYIVSQVSDEVITLTAADIDTIVRILVQIIIGVATIYGIFKKSKKNQ
jgi:hypothetical protein